MSEDKEYTLVPQAQMVVTDEMISAARAEMRPFVPPNNDTLRKAIGAAIAASPWIRRAADDR